MHSLAEHLQPAAGASIGGAQPPRLGAQNNIYSMHGIHSQHFTLLPSHCQGENPEVLAPTPRLSLAQWLSTASRLRPPFPRSHLAGVSLPKFRLQSTCVQPERENNRRAAAKPSVLQQACVLLGAVERSPPCPHTLPGGVGAQRPSVGPFSWRVPCWGCLCRLL